MAATTPVVDNTPPTAAVDAVASPAAAGEVPTTPKSPTATPASTRIAYADATLMEELDNVTEQLTNTRKSLWSTQDKLKEAQETVRKQEMHISELVAAHDYDTMQLKRLQEANTKSLEEEMKIRESFELMKKVFARSQLKSKEDQETIALLSEESDLLREENDQLRLVSNNKEKEKAQLNHKLKESNDRTKQLTGILERMKAELSEYKVKYARAEEAIKTLNQKLVESREKGKEEAERKFYRQRRVIDSLERQVLELRVNDKPIHEDDLLKRAILDEDLDDGLARHFMQSMNCTSFNDDIAGNVYPMFTNPLGTM